MIDVSRKYFREAGGDHHDARFYQGDVYAGTRSEILLKLLEEFSRLCKKLDIAPILMHGGLIGWYWCQRLLPWDDDLDLCLTEDHFLALANPDEIRTLYDTRFYLLDVNPNHVEWRSLNEHHEDRLEPNRIDARFIHIPTGLFIDITCLRAGGGDVLFTKCPHRYRVEDLLPLAETRLCDVPVYVPNRVAAVLAQEYGSAAIKCPVYGPWEFNALTRTWESVLDEDGALAFGDLFR